MEWLKRCKQKRVEVLGNPGGSTGGSTSTTYSTSDDAIIKSFERTLRCLYDDLEMTFDWSENLNMQSIGGPIQMGDCNLSDPMPHEEAICACEQSIYHANLDGHECNNYNIQYWYHPDYLGSVEFVTDRDGEAYQFFLNTPWGENLESHSSYSYKSFDSRFRFNGKELDPETGNYYYGARYYDPKVSVWLSVDPWTSKYPHLTPYNFVENTPVMLLDPTGLGPEEPNGPTHELKEGETLYGLVNRDYKELNVTVEQLKEWNDIEDETDIPIGTEIRLYDSKEEGLIASDSEPSNGEKTSDGSDPNNDWLTPANYPSMAEWAEQNNRNLQEEMVDGLMYGGAGGILADLFSSLKVSGVGVMVGTLFSGIFVAHDQLTDYYNSLSDDQKKVKAERFQQLQERYPNRYGE